MAEHWARGAHWDIYSLSNPDSFFHQARRLTIVDGYKLRDGSFQPAKDVIIHFADGRRLDGNEAGDGGTNIQNDVMRLLIEKTGLTPEHAITEEGIPSLRTH